VPRLLVDTAVLSGQANSLPLHWLDGFGLLPFAPRALTPDTPHAHDADALLVRTATRVDAQLLAALPHLRAVATLSSGTDHLDELELTRRGLSLHTGHGGNALAVADWVQWVLTRLPLANRRVLIVGVGAVGQAVAQRLGQEGLEVTLCDPPRAELEPDFPPLNLDAALDQAPWGAVTLHVPKVVAGPHATANLLDRSRLERLRGAVVLNAARGGVLDEVAATELRAMGHLAGLAIDTFEAEPHPRPALLEVADVITPHIAGHSIEGKLKVAYRAVASLRAALGMPPPGSLDDAIAERILALQPRDLTAFSALDAACRDLRADPTLFEVIRHRHSRTEQILRPA
jgi:erythronate-4-phosphate dehydrogenase